MRSPMAAVYYNQINRFSIQSVYHPFQGEALAGCPLFWRGREGQSWNYCLWNILSNNNPTIRAVSLSLTERSTICSSFINSWKRLRLQLRIPLKRHRSPILAGDFFFPSSATKRRPIGYCFDSWRAFDDELLANINSVCFPLNLELHNWSAESKNVLLKIDMTNPLLAAVNVGCDGALLQFKSRGKK